MYIIDNKLQNNRGPRGYVEIYESEAGKEEIKKLIGKSNLVVYLGREWLAQKMINQNNSNVASNKNEFICWLGLGSGGCPAGDPLNPTSPTNDDTDLDTEIPISATDSTCADFHDGAYYKHPFDSMTFQQDENNSDAYIIVKVTTTISASDANGYNISEAGLFTALSDSGGYSGDFNLYARVTFPTQVKTSSRILTFLWYLYV